MPEASVFSWRSIALVSLLPIVLIGVLLTLVLRGKDTTSMEAIGPSSSSVSSTLNAASSVAISSSPMISSASTTVASSSASAVADAAPIAPFDGCPGTVKYYDQPWFAGVRAAAEKSGMYLDDFSSVPEACLSADYFIAVYRTEFGKSAVVRYDRGAKTFAKATIEGTAAAPVANAFGKRTGDIIPLVLDGCSSGTYDVRRNVVTGNGERCETRYCSMTPIPTAIGRDTYPASPKYAFLGMLGELFTAADCGDARLKQLYGQDQTFGWGIDLRLKAAPGTKLESALRDAGFQCTDEGCTAWEQSATRIPVGTLAPLRSYVDEMQGYSCIHCG